MCNYYQPVGISNAFLYRLGKEGILHSILLANGIDETADDHRLFQQRCFHSHKSEQNELISGSDWLGREMNAQVDLYFVCWCHL